VILAGDVGATKTLLGLFRQADGGLKCVRECGFASDGFRSFDAMLGEFLGPARPRIHRCVVGVAGPVVEGRSRMVNLRWTVDARRLARGTGTDAVRVINDLEATAWSIPAISPRRMANLTPGVRSRPGHAALIAAGTGLGVALMRRNGEGWLPGASEGGHQAFAPRDEVEIELMHFLRSRHGRVSLERVVSGPGLLAIYEFFVQKGRGAGSGRARRLLAGADDPSAAIARAGLAREDPVAVRALDRFVSLYGAAAGDLALVAGATAGIYVGGGIAPKILPRLREGGFMRAFRDKGRLAPVVARIPVRVLCEPRAGLLGAARCASRWQRPKPNLRSGRG